MRFPFLLKGLLAGAVITTSAAADDEWTVTLVQKHLESSGVFQGSVAREGSRVSFAPIPEGGSEFNLWAYRNGPLGLEEHLVDTETVGAYLPKGTLWITTADPYAGGIPRTRIDQGFTLNFEIEGLRKGGDAPKAAKKVLLDHNVAAATGDPKTSNLGPEEDFGQSFLTRNGTGAINFSASNIPGTDPYNDSGVETFRLFALPDGQTAELELSKAEVQVWPMSKATISGVTKSSYTIAPEVTVDLVNLYPESETWVQVYPGPESLGTNGTRLTESFALVSDVKPRDSVLRFTKLDSVLLDSGEWTLEVITRTPFGIERIAHTSINIDRDLALRGSFQALSDQ
ncbi:hypothetical protein [Roseibacillus persicicus]|uniref:hypothetical protein n=1 Tax=Roseibacillus persicicus TaxID=454148 RepID=UPI00280DE15E|nr:hypothetical protein [Roseibacillus persicicus]MDQ8189433.1 hypothetical protein [Roseibacillus persicicus]